MLDTSFRYQTLSRDMDKSLKVVASDPIVERETAYYLENIRDIKSVDDFLADYRIYNYAMEAFGLEDMTYAKAFMRKVLTEGVDDKKSFANQLADERYRDFAKTFNFARYGETTTSFSRTQQGIVDMNIRHTLEVDEGSQNEGVRLALYFSRKADTIESAYDILADEALAVVVRTGLGLPQEVGLADIDAQAKLLEDRLDMEDFQDPEKVEAFIQRFAALWDLENGQTVENVPNIMLSGPLSAGIGESLLMSIQNLKLGGA